MDTYFGENGLLAKSFEKFEPRTGQLKMAEAVQNVLKGNEREYERAEILLVEAETGIGKTLAYLLPAVLSGKRLVVSTATINLQDQILKKEIPLLTRILGEEIEVVCIKGRQNYLCYYRWYQYRSSPQLTVVDDGSCDKVDEWLLSTETGDRAELEWLHDHSPLWPKISAQSHQCLGGECPEAPRCFINELRRKAGSARLMIVNHHLFFSDLALRKAGFGEILPRYQGVIFDEAHHLENVASTFFGKSFSQYQVLDLVQDVERQAEADLPPSLADKMISSIRGLKKRVDDFSRMFPLERGRFPLGEFIEGQQEWHDDVGHLASGLERIISELELFTSYGEGWKTLLKRTEELHGNLLVIALPDVVEQTRQVHWYERRERAISLSSTPIHVAENLREILYPAVECCILTSATLTTAGNFSYVCERLGLEGDVNTLRLQSPFNYQDRTQLYIPENDFPLPSERRYTEELCQRIYDILQITEGRALILCTSFKGMDSVAEFLEDHLQFPVLVQGRASRYFLLQQFKEEVDSVLVAVASFWEGVDVPGPSLSCVIIDKLPFEVPSDPVLQARIAAVREAGGNPFFDFQIPRAILTLRQGVGRLMRASDDRGLLAIMDPRLYSKGYGRIFLASLPPSPVVRNLQRVDEFFELTGK
ncbi:ATP-dependent DNA helicase [Desulfopila inferna]|uniref:ATP-dependent DNA helicase n=1 Tax=Desulfopila inferna TaxID=468528 RepID=UPI0019665181|nr:ATP-dependent DNA helicase [Desulfopila inferna]MBM9605515.1 ATP-dependent DNA helicase [Desulfopila inferna]